MTQQVFSLKKAFMLRQPAIFLEILSVKIDNYRTKLANKKRAKEL